MMCFWLCSHTLPAQDTTSRSKGYIGTFKIGLLSNLAANDWGASFEPTIQTMHGYRFNSHFALLGGLEISVYNQMAVLPVLMAFKGTLRKHGTTPFVVAELGYALELEPDYYIQQNYRGGGTLGLEVGLQFPISRKTAITSSVGYRLQSIGYNNFIWQLGGWYRVEPVRESLQNLHMRIGISF